MKESEFHAKMNRFFGEDPRKDAQADTSFAVTRKHITKGIQNDPWRCPIAAACSDRGVKAVILKEIAWVKTPDRSSPTGFVNLRYRIKDWLNIYFDEGRDVEPQLVTLLAPSYSQTLGYKRDRARESNARKRVGAAPRGSGAVTVGMPRGVEK